MASLIEANADDSATEVGTAVLGAVALAGSLQHGARRKGYCAPCFSAADAHPKTIATSRTVFIALFRLASAVLLVYDIITDWRLFYHVGNVDGYFADVFCCADDAI